MSNGLRRLDDDSGLHQEWATDTSNGGKPSGEFTFEIAFDKDDPDGQWTTHLIRGRENYDRRLSRGDRTAIMIEGVDHIRKTQISDAIHAAVDDPGYKGTQRAKILRALAEMEGLDWTA